MSLIEEIKEKRNELEKLEQEYIDQTPSCQNVVCTWFRESLKSGNCTWTVLLEDCPDYESEEKEVDDD